MKPCGDAALLKFALKSLLSCCHPPTCPSPRRAPSSASCHSFPKRQGQRSAAASSPLASPPLRMNSLSTRQHQTPAAGLTQACFHSGFHCISCFHVLLVFSGVQVCIYIFLPDKTHTHTQYYYYYVYSQKTMSSQLDGCSVKRRRFPQCWDSEGGATMGGPGGLHLLVLTTPTLSKHHCSSHAAVFPVLCSSHPNSNIPHFPFHHHPPPFFPPIFAEF